MKKIYPDNQDYNFWLEIKQNFYPIKEKITPKRHRFSKKQIIKNTLKQTKTTIKSSEDSDIVIKEPSKNQLSSQQLCDKNIVKKQLQMLKENNYQKIDLHNHTINEAFIKLSQFIKINYATNQRRLLVITGKSSKNPNQSIQEEFIRWIHHTKLKNYIIHCSHAEKNYGGTGAFFIILKKQPNT